MLFTKKLSEVSKMTKNELLENYTMEELANMILSLKNEKAKLACELSKLKAEAKTAKKNDCLPDSPIDVARMLINATCEYETNSLQRAIGFNEKELTAKYSCEELREICGYLENYCDFNEDDE
jgi:septin family protein